MPDFIDSLLIHAIVHFTHLFFINISLADDSIAKWMAPILQPYSLNLFSDFADANVCHMPLYIQYHHVNQMFVATLSGVLFPLH